MSLKTNIDILWKDAEYSRRAWPIEDLTEEHRRLQDKYATLCQVVDILLAHASEHAQDQVHELLSPKTD